jgi:hypothetical protein
LRCGGWSNIPQNTVLPANASFDTFNLHLARLQEAVARDSASRIRRTNFDSQETIQNASNIDRQLVGWTSALPLSWLPIRITDR